MLYDNFYENFRIACSDRGTTITEALRAIGRATSNTGTWKLGKYPNLEVVLELAEHLHMSLDELVKGSEASPEYIALPKEDKEWLAIIHRIPADRQQLCKDFLRTHMVQQETYTVKKSG